MQAFAAKLKASPQTGNSNAAVSRSPAIGAILRQTDTAFEQEASHVADQTMRVPVSPAGAAILRRQIAPGENAAPSRASDVPGTRRPENGVDSRCAKKMESFIRDNWLADIMKKYEGGSIADYDEFKNDVFVKLGAREFQSFEDGQNSFSCCAECFTIDTSADPADGAKLISHGRRETLRHDTKSLSELQRNDFPVIQSILLKDGNAFSVMLGIVLMPPGECFPA